PYLELIMNLLARLRRPGRRTGGRPRRLSLSLERLEDRALLDGGLVQALLQPAPAGGHFLPALTLGRETVGQPPLNHGIAGPQQLTVTSAPTAANSEIGGEVWNDLNGNGVRESNEPGLQGWTIYLDANNNSQFDTGERNTRSDATGGYLFDNLPA